MSSLRPRCLVLGLDGLPLSLARTLAARYPDFLPNLAELANDPRTLSISAEIPELSPVNWTSFYTAAGPEEHGVFGFSRINALEYKLSVCNFSQVAVPTIFDILGRKGLVSKVLNLPNTYPARPIPGMLVSGFVALDLRHAVHPPFLAGPLGGINYRLETNTDRGRTDHEFLLKDLEAVLASRMRALDLMWPDLAWDLFVFVLTETDRLFHFLFPALTDEAHPLHSKCIRFMGAWDKALGAVLEKYRALPEPKRLLILADHGFTTLKTEVDINAWLKKEGLLTVEGEPADEWDCSVIAPRTEAFALDPGRIYIHNNRFARGHVPFDTEPALKERIRSGLMDLKYQGEKVMLEVHAADELYPGPMRPAAPDLVCTARPGFDLKAKFDRDEVFGFHGRTGTHTVDDAFFHDSEGSRPDRVRDVGKTVLDYFNGLYVQS